MARDDRFGGMTDVFISYARSTETQARQVAAGLRAQGYSVWSDEDLPPSQPYADVIEERLGAAKAILVLWSDEAIRSHWVRAEADVARQAGVLVQVNLDGAKLPLPFSQIHCEDLRRWSGDPAAPAWRKVVACIADMSGGTPPEASRSRRRPAQAQAGPLLAVLAFDTLSGDAEMAYFSDGVSEDILQAVAKLAGVEVIGRASSFQFRGAGKIVGEIVAALRATHLLDGSVRRSGQRVRISASLTACATQTTLWSERFDRDLTDIFALQDEIAAAVAAALKLVFAPAAPAPKIDPAAYDLYLKARSLAGAPNGNRQCLVYLEEAVGLAPDFAAAWASLAMARAIELRWRPEPGLFAIERDRVAAAAGRASELDPALGLPFVAQSLLEAPAAYGRREAWLEKAAAAAPDDPEVLKHTSDFRLAVGRVREGFALIARAHEVDPLNRTAALNWAAGLADIGGRDESYAAFDAARARWSDFDWLVSAPLLTAALLDDWPRAEPLLGLAQSFPAKAMRIPLSTVALLKAPRETAQTTVLALAERQLALPAGRSNCECCSSSIRSASPTAAISNSSRGATSAACAWAKATTPTANSCRASSSGPPTRRCARIRGSSDSCAKLGLCSYWVESGRLARIAPTRSPATIFAPRRSAPAAAQQGDV